jgi:murein DD-endopeptidase MepM/ murein hydrolase activator NlpD
MPKYRRHQYITKFLITIFNLALFNYVIIYADKFQVTLEQAPVKANFVDTKLSDNDDSVSVRLDNVIIDDTKIWGNITYVIKPWDTIESIATDVGTTIANIRRVNSLGNDAQVRSNGTMVNKEWISINKLTISDLPGIVVAMDTKTSVAEFAKQYALNEDDIKSLNNISDSKTILREWDELFLTISEQDAIKKWILEDPNPVVETVLVAKTTPTESWKKPEKPIDVKQVAVATPKKKWTAKIISAGWSAAWTNGIIWYDKWSILATWFQKDRWYAWFAAWYCTSYAASRRKDIFSSDTAFRWNASAWYANAKRAGNKVWSKPRVWSIVVFAPGRWAWWYGHVWYVEQVDGDKVIISDMNYKGRNIVTRRVIDADLALGYIY